MGALKLTVLKNGAEVQSWESADPAKNSVVLGRGDSADIKLEDRAVSRNHALISFNSAGAIVVQKKTEFGKLQLNGQEVTESGIKPGDVISIADYQVRVESVNRGAVAGAEPVAESPVATAAPEGAAVAEEHPQIAVTMDNKTPPQGTNIAELESSGTPSLEVPKDESSATGDAKPEQNAAADQNVESEKTAVVSMAQVVVKLFFKTGEANVEEYEIKKPEISIGRGSSCDVIIEDKKSSRKHAIIRRAGTSFFIKDLGSANGTFVNNIKVSEQELAGEDVIKIGSTEFVFRAINQEYFSQEQQGNFLQVSPPASEAPTNPGFEPGLANPQNQNTNPELMIPGGDLAMASAQMPMDPSLGMPGAVPDAGAVPGAIPPGGAGAAIPGMAGVAGIPGMAPSKPARESLLVKFRALPPKKKIIYGLFIAAAMFFLLDSFNETETTQKPAEQAKVKDPKMAEFMKLPKEKRKFIEATYETAMDYFTKRNFEQAQYEASKIKEILPNGYKDSNELIENARRGQEILKAQAEETAKKEAEEKRRALVLQLVSQAQEYYQKGMEAEAKEVFNRILEIDPDNPTVAKLKAAIEEKEQQRRLEEEQKRQIELMKASMQSIIDSAKALRAQGKYYETLDKLMEVPSAGSDVKLLEEAKDEIEVTKKELADKRQPHVDAGNAAYDVKDYVKAREEYAACLKVDRRSTECKDGIARIRHDVHERAQKIYIEAIIAESVSDLTAAKKKYLECFQSSVPEDEYYGRCWRKYHRFVTLENQDTPVDNEGKPLRAPASSAEEVDPFTKEVLEFL